MIARHLLCSAVFVLLAALGTANALEAQANSNLPHRNAEVALTFQTVRAEHTLTSDSFWLQGGSVQFAGELFHGIAAVADFSGGNSSASGNSLSLVTYTFGPRYTFRPRHGRAAIFVQALGGQAEAFNGTFSGGSGSLSNPANSIQNQAHSLALRTGGGIDFQLSSHFAIRAVQAEYLRTQLPNAGSDVQNNLSLGAGVVLRLTRP